MKFSDHFDWRVLFLITLIIFLAFTATVNSRIPPGTNKVAGFASENDKYSEVNKQNVFQTQGVLNRIIARTLEDPVALYTFVLTVATLLLFVATVGLWHMARLQSNDTKESIRVSSDANDVARQAFEVSQRPWLAFEHLGPSRVSLHLNSLRFQINIAVHNHGQSPAVSVHFGCVLARFRSGTDIWGALTALSDRAMIENARSLANPIVIFPSQQRILETAVAIDFSREEIDGGRITVFGDYFIILTYRHPTTNKIYCTASGFGFMRENCLTYSSGEHSFDAWPVHAIPGCNFVA